MWLIGAMVCLLTAPWVQLSVSVGNGWPHNALRHHWLMPISCHFRDCKALLGKSDESEPCKRRYNKCPDLYFLLYSALYDLLMLRNGDMPGLMCYGSQTEGQFSSFRLQKFHHHLTMMMKINDDANRNSCNPLESLKLKVSSRRHR